MRKIPTTIKLPAVTRQLVEQAARKRGITLSDYIRDALFEQAAKTLEACSHCGQPHPAKVA
jgi:uncharacterized protein (DUF1778 family)